jgi:N-acetylglucosamine-6-sulfatase
VRWGVRAVVVAISLAIGASGALSRARAGLPPGPQPRPNVLVIETDDQTLASMKIMRTVNARIAEQGVTFRDSFVNFSLCCPSRATFLTGLYAHNHRVRANHPPVGGFPKFERRYGDNNLAVWLERAGYSTALIGKYLNGYEADPIVPPGWSEWDGVVGASIYDYNLNQNGQIVHYGTDPTDYKQDVLTGKAIEFIDRTPTPFFLWLTYSSPHTNGPDPSPQPPDDCTDAAKPAPRHADAFDSQPLPTPPNFNEADLSDKPQAIQSLPLLTGPKIDDLTRKYRCALESLLSVDEGVGQILDQLKRSGQLADTYVIYTSDNGFFNGEHRILAGKTKLYEESIRVPLLIRGPGIPRSKTAHDLVVNADLAPTIVQATGAKPGLNMDGRTLLPVARNPRTERGRELPIESRSFNAIRSHRYIYAQHASGETELYDLQRDPFELQNLANDPAYADVASKLAQRLEDLKSCRGKACRTHPQVKPKLRYRIGELHGRRCARNPIQAGIQGADAGDVLETEFYADGQRLASDTSAPFSQAITLMRGPATIGIRSTMVDGRRITSDRRLRACGVGRA